MGRRKAAQHCDIRPWLSAKSDGKEGRFLQIGNSLLLCDAFQSLSGGAKTLYLCMAMESAGRKDFEFSASAMKKYGIVPRCARRWITELTESGFISCESSGKNTRTANQYSFCFDWKTKKAMTFCHSVPPCSGDILS